MDRKIAGLTDGPMDETNVSDQDSMRQNATKLFRFHHFHSWQTFGEVRGDVSKSSPIQQPDLRQTRLEKDENDGENDGRRAGVGIQTTWQERIAQSESDRLQ